MAPFQYQPYDNRFGATIADILAHQNDSAARSAENIASIQAQGAGASSRAWGNAVQHIGGSIADMLDPRKRQALALQQQQMDLQTQRLGMQNREMEAELGDRERARAARTALAGVIAKTPRNPDGTYNTQAILQGVPEEFLGDAQQAVSMLEKFNQSAGEENRRKQQGVVQAASQFMASGAWQDPIAMDAFVSTLENNAMITKDEGNAYRVKLFESPENGKLIVSRFAAPGKVEKLGPGDMLVQDGRTVAENKAPEKPFEHDPMKDLVKPDGTVLRPAQPKPEARDTRSLQTQANEAHQRGDNTEYQRLLKVIKDTGQADDRPHVGPALSPDGLPAPTARRVDMKSRAFEALPAVKKVQTMADAVGFAKSLDTHTKNPSDDQALIYAFAKAMDPESVVREGEYNTVQKYSQSWAERYGFQAARIFSNTTFLTPEARQNMKTTIESRFKAAEQQYVELRKSYVEQINQITGKPDGDSYLTDFSGAFPTAPPPATAPATPAAAPAAASKPALGSIVSVKGQRVRVTKMLPNGKFEGVAVP